jgi:hypothetical protein
MEVHVRVQSIEDKIADYVENNPIEVYVDYRDELSDKQIELILAGKVDEARNDVEEKCNMYDDSVDADYYWDEVAEKVGCDRKDVDAWRISVDGFWPSYNLDDHGWRQLLHNTNVKVEAVLWDVAFNMNNWAYGYPVSYSDVKDTLKLFGINPLDFKKNVSGGSMTAGEGKLKGYFPDMPDRVPKIELKELFDNMCALYDGVVVFCLGDLENIAEVLSSDSKNITFKKETNAVIHEFSGGAGITEVSLTEDLVIPRKNIDFRVSGKYGVQDCYGFIGSYWKQGVIQKEGL